MADRRAAVAAEEVSVRARERGILTGCSFTVESGQRLSIIGPNGAGKSTLLRVLCGFIVPRAGEVRIFGRPLAALDPAERAAKICYVPQNCEFVFPVSVHEFVSTAARPALAGDSYAARTAAALTRTALTGLRDRDVRTLSGGERQRALIAGAIAQGAEILLVDEPTAFLDVRFRDEIDTLLDSLAREEGRTIVRVTHNLETLAAHSDAVIALRDGAVVFDGSPRALAEAGGAAALFGAAAAVGGGPA